MMDYSKYFEDFNKEWVEDAYNSNGYNYPVGLERLRLLMSIISDRNLKNLKVLDIGCGDGSISYELSKLGCMVTGVDRSKSMIDLCNEKKANFSDDLKNHISFKCLDFDEIPNCFKGEQFDLVIAFGLIGYLDSDESFFRVISEITHDASLLIISWRNALFNFFSGSRYMRGEVETSDVQNYDKYMKCLSSKPPIERHISFLKKLKNTLNQIDLDTIQLDAVNQNITSDKIENLIEAKQHDSENLSLSAKQQGWKLSQTYTVHPHLLPATLNKEFPPHLYNLISEALSVYNDLDISFAWSSVGVGLFTKQGEK